jgi:hypothetical protein
MHRPPLHPPHLLQRPTGNPSERYGGHTPRSQHGGRDRGEDWSHSSSTRAVPPPQKRAEPLRSLRTRVSPLMELQDPEVFEVILMGNNMLPLVKRLGEFEQLSEQMQRVQSGTPPLHVSQRQPALVAKDIQAFLDGLLAAIGLDDDTPQGNLLKSFLGLWCSSNGTVSWAKPQRDAPPAKSPRNALQPLHNQSMPAQQHTQASQPVAPSPAGPASGDEKAAALELIRRRREAARAQKQQQQSAPAMQSAEEKANIIRSKMVEALNDSGNQGLVAQQLQSPEMSGAAYSAALREGFSTSAPAPGASPATEQVWEHPPAEHPPPEQVEPLEEMSSRRNFTRKFVRQAHVLLEQMDTTSKLKTWVNCSDEEAGLTFTQSICGESVIDVAIPLPAPVETAVTPRRANAMAGAPAPMESSSTTSNRVAAVAGYTASFRDIRSKFANAVDSISDQEYASSLLTSQNFIQRTQEDEGAFKPNQEVFEYLVNILKGEEEEEAGADKESLYIRTGIAICNLCLNSSHNRDMIAEAGGIDALSTRLAQAVAEDDFKMQAVVSACFANMAADRKLKELIVQSSAMQSLEQVLLPCPPRRFENLRAASYACTYEMAADMRTLAGTIRGRRGGGFSRSRRHLEYMRR